MIGGGGTAVADDADGVGKVTFIREMCVRDRGGAAADRADVIAGTHAGVEVLT